MRGPERIDDIDWRAWRPKDLATLLFVIRDREILLIRKKRGLGAGKINGPGGRLEGDESPLECAVRETREELCITAIDPSFIGELRFHFLDGYTTHVSVFRAGTYTGTPSETDEAAPLWYPIDALPYDEMWEDDFLWYPLMIAGEPFSGHFIFDGDRLLDHRLATVDSTAEATTHPTGSHR